MRWQEKTPKSSSKSRRTSTPCAPSQLSKGPALRTHKRSSSGGGGTKDMEALSEDVASTEFTSKSPVTDKTSRRRSSSSDRETNENASASTTSEEILKAMMAKETGINFLPEMRGLPPGCFLGTDATSWFLHHVRHMKCRSEAVELGQKMMDEGLIQHASRSEKQAFVDGFYLYCIVKSSDRNQTKKPDESEELKYRLWEKKQYDLLYNFQAKWFEVVMRKSGSESTCSIFGSFNQCEEEEFVSQTEKKPKRSSFASVGVNKKIPSQRDAEINLDPLNSSDRPEWCTVRYHGIFCPDNAYVVNLRWLISTGSVLNQLVQSWARKVTLYGFHLVPVPTFMPDGKLARDDPFTMPHFIALDEACFEQHVSKKDMHCQEFETRMFLFQEAVLKRFGFIKDFPYNEGIYKSYQTSRKTSAYRYIHYTGALFMTIVDREGGWESYGYVWMINTMLTKRWKSSVTLDSEAAKKLVQDLRDFCKNKSGKLERYLASLDGKCAKIDSPEDKEGFVFD